MRFRIVFAAACALLAALLCAVYAQHVQAQTEQERAEALERYGGETVKLVVATKDLAAGETVTKEDLAVKEWLSDLAPAVAMTDMDDCIGRKVTSAVPKGTPLCSLQFAQGADAADVPSGHVALSLALSDKVGLPAEAKAG